MPQDINLAACMTVKNHIGYDEFVNVCTGTVSRVEWTGLDWLGSVLVATLIGFVLTAMATLAVLVAKAMMK